MKREGPEFFFPSILLVNHPVILSAGLQCVLLQQLSWKFNFLAKMKFYFAEILNS